MLVVVVKDVKASFLDDYKLVHPQAPNLAQIAQCFFFVSGYVSMISHVCSLWLYFVCYMTLPDIQKQEIVNA